MSHLQLSLLGIPEVKHGERIVTFSTRKALALLAYLAVEEGTHTRKALSEAFWPELDAEHGRAALRATLLELRKLLERSHRPGEQAHLLIERDTLALDPGNLSFLDLRIVEAVSKQAGGALADEASTPLQAQFEQATRLARGPFLSGFTLRDSQFFDDWARQQREYWHLRTQQLFDSLSQLYERAGEKERAIDVVNRWLGFEHLSEEGYRRLMRLRFALGDRVGALRAYATCCTILADELQIEPEPETIALAKHLRHTTPFHQSSACPPDISSGQLLTHLLDVPLLGRSVEFSALIEGYQRVHAGQSHLILLQGESGVGKTSVATEFVSWAQAQKAHVLWGRAIQTVRPLPYQPIIDILRRILQQEQAPDTLISDLWLSEISRLLPELRDRFPDLPVSVAGEELGHHRLFEAITRLFRRLAADCPLVLLLDDLQWADTATLDLLLYLTRSLAEQPTQILLLLILRAGAGDSSDQQVAWSQALKRTRIPITLQTLAPFDKAETQRFVQALAWVEQSCEGEAACSIERCRENGGSFSIYRDELIFFADWLYIQTMGQPFYLVEMLKGLLEREIILPSLQKDGNWGLILKYKLLRQTEANDLIPSSVREFISSHLRRLTPQARSFLVAAAALETGLTFERLCRIAQVDEQTGLDALEELVRSGLLCERKRVVEAETSDGYSFPGELMREVVYQEAGATRQRLMQRRVELVIQEEVVNDLDAVDLPHFTPQDRQTPESIRDRRGKWAVPAVVNRGRRDNRVERSKDSSDISGQKANNRHQFVTPAGSIEGSVAITSPRSPPDRPASVFVTRIGSDEGDRRSSEEP